MLPTILLRRAGQTRDTREEGTREVKMEGGDHGFCQLYSSPGLIVRESSIY
jgi:hypothetical protein